ncbi:GNAT family N-acetyltransferase [Anaerolineales bacterium HSG25]|nr:GNAT family N-acetyltransferase [Anaerolineales bacterium HSG25]
MQISDKINALKQTYSDKFVLPARAFRHIRRGDRIFVGTGCAQPQHLVQAMVDYVKKRPKAFVDTEILHMWSLGVTPYSDERYKDNFRHNSFYISDSTRDAVNQGFADYTPIFLSQAPDLFRRDLIPLDVALIQISYPDAHGYVNLGVSVDIAKAAIESAKLVIAQLNQHVPRVHGDGFIHLDEVDFIIPHDEPLLEYKPSTDDETIQKIGRYVSHLIQDGDTLQVGEGSTPNAVLGYLDNKKDLGIHTELLTDNMVKLMQHGVINNVNKTFNRGRTIASFCMGTQATYDYMHDNPAIEFRTIDYTNNPMLIARHDHMIAINGALQIDLTGQSSAESVGSFFYSGIGGQADFMRGATLARNGKTILALPSTSNSGISRIMPFLKEGAGVTLNRGDVHYVVTEYGIAYLHGKNIRERAMALTAVAHPDFRSWLIEEARQRKLIYLDQTYMPGEKGAYPSNLENFRTTKTGLEVFMRPLKISDEPMLKTFFYDLTEQSLYTRFMAVRNEMPHERLQNFMMIDYTKDMVILALLPDEEREILVGVGEYYLNPDAHTAEASFLVQDGYQGQGLGTELLIYMTQIAKKQGLLGFSAETLMENIPMLRVFENVHEAKKTFEDGIYFLDMPFRKK